MNCKQCGEPMPDGSIFCTNCGSRITSPADYTTLASPAATAVTAALKSASEVGSPPDSEVKMTVTEQSEQSVKSSVVGKITIVTLSILLGILTFAFITVFIALTVVRPANIPDIIGRADISRIIEDIGLTDEVVAEINNSIIIDITFDISGIKDFLKRETVSAEISRVMEKYVEAVKNNDFDYHITAREIVSLVKSVAPDIRDEFDYKLTNEDYNAINESLNTKVNLKDYRIGKLMENAGMIRAIPYLLFSVYPLIIIAILCVLCVVNIVLLNRKKVRSAFIITGVPLILSGLLYSVAGLLIGAFPWLFADRGLYKYIRVAVGLVNLMLFRGLICLMLGILFLVAYFIIKIVKKQPLANNYSVKGAKTWRLAGLITNLYLIMTCAVCALLCYLNLP